MWEGGGVGNSMQCEPEISHRGSCFEFLFLGWLVLFGEPVNFEEAGPSWQMYLTRVRSLRVIPFPGPLPGKCSVPPAPTNVHGTIPPFFFPAMNNENPLKAGANQTFSSLRCLFELCGHIDIEVTNTKSMTLCS